MLTRPALRLPAVMLEVKLAVWMAALLLTFKATALPQHTYIAITETRDTPPPRCCS